MEYKKLVLSFLLLYGVFLTSLQAQTILVKEIGGSETAFSLNDLRKISFSSGNLIVTKKDNSNGAFTLNGLQRLSYLKPTKIEELKIPKTSCLKIYPNPVSVMLTIELVGFNSTKGFITVLNLEGRVMQSKEVRGNNIFLLDMSQIPHGIYICRYCDGENNRSIKFIKQ